MYLLETHLNLLSFHRYHWPANFVTLMLSEMECGRWLGCLDHALRHSLFGVGGYVEFLMTIHISIIKED
jgi:hypothetical protein